LVKRSNEKTGAKRLVTKSEGFSLWMLGILYLFD